jgi:hypothetical protein
MAAELAAVPAAKPAQARYTFTVPAKARMFEADPATVTMVPLTMDQDMQGSKMFDQTKNPYQKIALGIVAVDGKPVSWVDGQVDSLIAKWSPPVRDLVAKAHFKLNQATDEDAASFLGSMVTSV